MTACEGYINTYYKLRGAADANKIMVYGTLNSNISLQKLSTR